MKRRFRRVRGGFIPPTPFYKKYRTAARSDFRTAPLSIPTRKPLSIPNISGRPVKVTVYKPKTATQPKSAAPAAKKKVQVQEMARTSTRRALRYLPMIMKRKPRYPMMRRKRGGGVQRITPTGEGATRSYYHNKRRLRKKLFGITRMSPEQRYGLPFFNRVTQISGRQAAWVHNTCTLPDLVALLATKPLATTFPSNTKQIYVKSITLKYMLTNTAATNVFIDIYQVIPKKDVNTSPLTAMDTGITQMNSVEGAISLGMTPYMSRYFTQNYTIKKTYRIELAAGRTHLHTCKYNIGKLWNDADRVASTGANFRKSWTHSLLMIATSEPINNVAGTLITSAPVSINTYSHEDYRYHFGETESKDLFYTGISAEQIGATGLQLYDEGSGTVEAFSAA